MFLSDRHSNETATHMKHVTKYKNMRKLMLEFFKKIEDRGIKIARVHSILISKSINLKLFTLKFVRCWGSVNYCDFDIFKLIASAQLIH